MIIKESIKKRPLMFKTRWRRECEKCTISLIREQIRTQFQMRLRSELWETSLLSNLVSHSMLTQKKIRQQAHSQCSMRLIW